MSIYVVEPPGERIDRIAHKLYGSEQGGTVEALLDANPGLAAHGVFVAGGTALIIPADVTTPASDSYVLPWE